MDTGCVHPSPFISFRQAPSRDSKVRPPGKALVPRTHQGPTGQKWRKSFTCQHLSTPPSGIISNFGPMKCGGHVHAGPHQSGAQSRNNNLICSTPPFPPQRAGSASFRPHHQSSTTADCCRNAAAGFGSAKRVARQNLGV